MVSDTFKVLREKLCRQHADAASPGAVGLLVGIPGQLLARTPIFWAADGLHLKADQPLQDVACHLPEQCKVIMPRSFLMPDCLAFWCSGTIATLSILAP